jgi:restriction system protein
MELAYREMKESLAQDLLARVKTCSPGFFENLVLDVLVAMGYGGSRDDAAQSVGQTGDGGIDGIIKQDRLGLDVLYVQAKRWENTVGRPVVQAFAGSLDGVKARKGVLITTSRFSKDATEYVDKIEKRIILVDGQQLAELMIAHEVGVSRVMSYDVKRVDQDYFED